MPYDVKRGANSRVEITATLDSEGVAQERTKIARSLRGQVKMPGFRPGKAPLAVVNKRFGTEITAQLKEDLVKTLWNQVAEGEPDLRPLAQPEFSRVELAEDGSFHMSATMEVQPHYDLPAIDSLKIEEVPIEITEEEVEEQLEKLQLEAANYSPTDDPAADGMLIEAEMRGVFVEDEEEFVNEDDAKFIVGSEGLFPEINEAVQGARPGDELEAEKRFPEDHSDPNRAGKTAQFSIKVKAVNTRDLPEIDDQLAAKVGLDNLEALRERLREVIKGRKIDGRNKAWERSLLDQLGQNADLNELPQSLLEPAIAFEVSRFAAQMEAQGASLQGDAEKLDELRSHMEPAVRRKVVDRLILEQLAADWGVEVPQEEIEEYLRMEATRQNVPLAELRDKFTKEGQLADMQQHARAGATVQELIRRVGGEID